MRQCLAAQSAQCQNDQLAAVNAAMEPIMAIATFEPHLYEAGEVIE